MTALTPEVEVFGILHMLAPLIAVAFGIMRRAFLGTSTILKGIEIGFLTALPLSSIALMATSRRPQWLRLPRIWQAEVALILVGLGLPVLALTPLAYDLHQLIVQKLQDSLDKE